MTKQYASQYLFVEFYYPTKLTLRIFFILLIISGWNTISSRSIYMNCKSFAATLTYGCETMIQSKMTSF